MQKKRKSYRINPWLCKRLNEARFKLGEDETEFVEEAIYERVLKVEEESRNKVEQ